MKTNTVLYADDFWAWTQDTARLIRDGKWYDLDPDALAEEVESLGARDHRELRRRLRLLLTHLLKWQYQPAKRQTGHSWLATIRTQRDELAALLEQSPSLRRTVPELLAARYRRAREDASTQTHLPLATFPPHCPWTPAQVLDDTFWPEAPPPHRRDA